jgi:hypothetical protein
MDVLFLGGLAGGIGVLLVLVIGVLLLKDRIAPVEVSSEIDVVNQETPNK